MAIRWSCKGHAIFSTKLIWHRRCYVVFLYQGVLSENHNGYQKNFKTCNRTNSPCSYCSFNHVARFNPRQMVVENWRHSHADYFCAKLLSLSDASIKSWADSVCLTICLSGRLTAVTKELIFYKGPRANEIKL